MSHRVHPLVPGVTDCQKNEAGLQCDQDGQYRASQRDGGSGKAFCVDGEGQRLPWSETDARLTDSQCLGMRRPLNQPRSRGADGCSQGLPRKGEAGVRDALVSSFLFWKVLTYVGAERMAGWANTVT